MTYEGIAQSVIKMKALHDAGRMSGIRSSTETRDVSIE